MQWDVTVIRTGTANTASVLAGLGRAGARPVLDNDPDALARADRVVLPGVGAMAAALDRLDGDGLRQVLVERIDRGRPTLAICLGLQLLCAESEESAGAAGLGVIDAPVRRFPARVQTPQMGWNRVDPDDGCRFLTPGYAYFANSYRLESAPPDWRAAWSRHDAPFVAALERGDVLACQFHPELSGDWGLQLLRNWLAGQPKGWTSC